MEKLISVIIPVFNVEKYLAECLNSVLTQTYKNLEVLLVDDGSSDGSCRICDEWARKDGRIKVIHKPNGGVSSARNEGLRASTGDFIGFVDADDWIEPEMYAILANGLARADMASCSYIDYPVGMDCPIKMGESELYTDSFEQAVIQVYTRNGYFRSMCNKLYRREIIWRGGRPLLLDERIAVGEDELWLIDIMKRSGSYAFIPEVGYHYRPRSGSITRLERVTEKRMSILSAKLKTIEKLSGNDMAVRYAQSVMYNDCFILKVQSYCCRDFEKAREIGQILKPLRRQWIGASDIPRARKLKVMMMECAMAMGLPGKWVAAISNAKGKGVRQIIR